MARTRALVVCLLPTLILSGFIANLNWNVVESRQLLRKWKPIVGYRLQDVTNARGAAPERLQNQNGDEPPALRIVPENVDQGRCVLLEEVKSGSSWNSNIYVTAEVNSEGFVTDIHAHTVRAMF